MNLCLFYLQSVFVNGKSCPNSDTPKEGYTLKTREGKCSIEKESGQEISGERFAELGASGKKREVGAFIILVSSTQKESVYFHTPKLLFQQWQSEQSL